MGRTVTRYETLNSVYEVDELAHRIRRTEGRNAPTLNQGTDGEWQSYDALSRTPEGGLSIAWGGTKYTWTSPVVRVETDALPV